MADFVALAEIQDLLGGVSRQRAAEIMARESFPAPLATLKAGRIWDRGAVESWIAEHRPTQRGDES